jgi:hypothetical protein
MNCAPCNHLIRLFELRSAAYAKARAAPFYRVCTEIAARELVDMERARADLDEHRLVCRFALAPRSPVPWGCRERFPSQQTPTQHPDRGVMEILP